MTANKKTVWGKTWGESSYLSRALTVCLLIGAIGTGFGFIVGWFDGCREHFENNPTNSRQDISIQELKDSMESFSKFRFHQRKKNAQWDSLFETEDLYRDNDSH